MFKIMSNQKSFKVFTPDRNDQNLLIMREDLPDINTNFLAQINTNLSKTGLLHQAYCTSIGRSHNLLQIITNIELAPKHALSLFSEWGGSSSKTQYVTITNLKSHSIGVPIRSTIGANSLNVQNSFKTIFRSIETTNLKAKTLLSRHVSRHDIAHMLTTLANKGTFPISKWSAYEKLMYQAVTEGDGFTSLFVVISAIYEIVISNTAPSRVLSRISNLRSHIGDYLQSTKTYQARIMSKENPLEDAFTL